MNQFNNCLTAMTAIAAVLALPAPVIAQDAQPAPVATADPLAATPPSAEPVPSTDPAPSATTIDPLSAIPVVEAAPAPQARTTARRAARTAPTPAPRARSTPRATTVTSPAPNIPAPTVAATPSAIALPAPAAAPAPVAASASNDLLPMAAAGGLGLLALLGAGVALRRRKRRDEEAEYAVLDEPAFEQPRIPAAFAEPAREPSMRRAPVMATPVAGGVGNPPADAPAASPPHGFDPSSFGPHVQAAYHGPSEDNPSLSLKNRLRRASAMDQMARTGDAPAHPAASRPLAASATARDTGAVVSKIRPAPNSSGGFILGGGTTRPIPRPVTQH